MSDDIDDANARADVLLAVAITNAARPIAAGVAGECDLCGEHSARLVTTKLGLACAPCRDRRHLP